MDQNNTSVEPSDQELEQLEEAIEEILGVPDSALEGDGPSAPEQDQGDEQDEPSAPSKGGCC